MGCFDFTYADNGNNMRGQKAYLYITDKLATALGTTSPLRVQNSDMYGRLYIKFSSRHDSIPVDVYAIYTAMLYLENELTNQTDIDIDNIQHFIQQLSDFRLHPKFCKELDKLDALEQCSDAIREVSIYYFFSHIISKETYEEAFTEQCGNVPLPKTWIIPMLGNQNEKEIRTVKNVFVGRIPLVLTRKKLPDMAHDPFFTIVKNWGYVSDHDPNQGFSKTTNHYLPWRPTE